MSEAVEHDVFQAIADPTRRDVLNYLVGKELYIGQISDKFPISRPAIAKHLRILTNAGLVESRKMGRKKFYALNAQPLREVKTWLSYFESFWENKLMNLKELAEKTTESQ